MNKARVVAAVFAAVLLPCALFGCFSSGAAVSSSSPKADVSASTISTSSDMTEDSQLVELRIPFDSELELAGNATADINVELDGQAADSKTVATEVAVQGSDLVVRLSPAQDASGISSGSYFALYQAKLAVKANSSDGALSHVTGQDGAAAVLDQTVQATVPSGMAIKQVPSNAASTSVKVTKTACLRCCTWFTLGQDEFYMHHHVFYQETPASCAHDLADQINASFPDNYKATAKGAVVTIKTLDGSQAPALKIVEGIGA